MSQKALFGSTNRDFHPLGNIILSQLKMEARYLNKILIKMCPLSTDRAILMFVLF